MSSDRMTFTDMTTMATVNPTATTAHPPTATRTTTGRRSSCSLSAMTDRVLPGPDGARAPPSSRPDGGAGGSAAIVGQDRARAGRECGEGLVQQTDEIEPAAGRRPVLDGDIQAVQSGSGVDVLAERRRPSGAGALGQPLGQDRA